MSPSISRWWVGGLVVRVKKIGVAMVHLDHGQITSRRQLRHLVATGGHAIGRDGSGPFDDSRHDVLAQSDLASGQTIAAAVGDEGQDLGREAIRLRPLPGLAARLLATGLSRRDARADTLLDQFAFELGDAGHAPETARQRALSVSYSRLMPDGGRHGDALAAFALPSPGLYRGLSGVGHSISLPCPCCLCPTSWTLPGSGLDFTGRPEVGKDKENGRCVAYPQDFTGTN